MVIFRNGANFKSTTNNVKLLCSHGGELKPRPDDQGFLYVGGDNRLLTVDRRIKFSDLVAKLKAVCSFTRDEIIGIKYQLPGEDKNLLISLTDEDDLEYMMIEHDYLRSKASPAKPVRFRLFLTKIDAVEKQSVDSGSDSSSRNADYKTGGFDNESTKSTLNSGKAFDLESWTIPRADEVTGGNTCAASKKLESPVAPVNNDVPVAAPVQNGGEFQLAGKNYGGVFEKGSNYGMVPAVGGVNGYRDGLVYVMAPNTVESIPLPEQRRIHDGCWQTQCMRIWQGL